MDHESKKAKLFLSLQDWEVMSEAQDELHEQYDVEVLEIAGVDVFTHESVSPTAITPQMLDKAQTAYQEAEKGFRSGAIKESAVGDDRHRLTIEHFLALELSKSDPDSKFVGPQVMKKLQGKNPQMMKSNELIEDILLKYGHDYTGSDRLMRAFDNTNRDDFYGEATMGFEKVSSLDHTAPDFEKKLDEIHQVEMQRLQQSLKLKQEIDKQDTPEHSSDKDHKGPKGTGRSPDYEF